MGDRRFRQPADFISIPPELIQHCGICQRYGLTKWVGEFTGQFQSLLGPCESLIRITVLPEKMARPAAGKKSKVDPEASDVRSALIRIVEDLRLLEVLCGGCRLSKGESHSAQFHMPQYPVERIPPLLGERQHIPGE